VGGALLLGGLLSLATPAAGGAGRVSSLELQLEIPKAASSESTRIVKATRAGVHNGFPALVLLFACISYLPADHSSLEAYHSNQRWRNRH
jgi:hypothetical protein